MPGQGFAVPGADLEVAAEPGRRCCLRPARRPARNLAPAQPGCRSSLRGSSGCPGAAAALLSGLIHILDVQAFGHCPPAGVTAHGCVPRARGANPAACREQDGAALRGCCSLGTRRGHEAHPRWRPRDGRRLAECPGVHVPVGSAGAPRRQRAVKKKQLPGKPQAQAPSPGPVPSPRDAERERAGNGRSGEPGGAGWLPWAEGHSQPEWLWARSSSSPRCQAELAPSTTSLCCTVPSHLPMCGSKWPPGTLAGPSCANRDQRGPRKG